MNIMEALGLRAGAATSTELRASLSIAQTGLAEAERVAAQLAEQHGAVILDGSAGQVQSIEQQLVDANADCARYRAVIAALPPRIAAAEKLEAGDRLDRLADETEALARQAAEIAPRVTDSLAALCRLIAEHDGLAERVKAGNRELRAGGRAGVRLPVARVWELPPPWAFDTFGASLRVRFAAGNETSPATWLDGLASRRIG